MDSIENIIERVGKTICLYQTYKVALRDFSAEDLKYLPMCYLEKYVSPFAIQQIWGKLPESYKSNPTFKLNLPCYEHYNKGELQIDGPPPPIKSCTGCKTTINGLIAVCAIVNQTLYCTTPLELQYKNPEGNLTISTIVQKLQVVLTNGTVVNLANKVYTIGNIMQIIYKPSVQTPQITLKYPNKKPINFTYEEFMKFLDFVYGFMANVEEKEDTKQVKWSDFVIGHYVFLSCCWNANDENACSLAIQDTHNTDYVALNKNEMILFTSEKYKLYEFVSTINKGKNY
ncbi:hypothetical protein ABEB36_004240 [Hypothenemus hampei]|uniref:Uncharacterized protein n=1 Tax=Hypothenemus hampei TaxID=57062 RepID=A0ABD1F309_HYPHA